MTNEDALYPLFEIEGQPIKKLFKKHRSHIAVYSDRIEIMMNGEHDIYTRNDIFDMYILEPAFEEIESRTTLIDFYEDGEENNYQLDDDTFPGLSGKIENVLKNEWAFLVKKRSYPAAVNWFTACCAVIPISCRQNPGIYGSQYKKPKSISGVRSSLSESWGFNNKQDLLDMLPKLLEGRAVSQYREMKINMEQQDAGERGLNRMINLHGGERCLWAWDLQRLIHISAYGFVADWLTWEESLDWSLKAGTKLQATYRGWDEFFDCYLLGYCFWSGESPDDENGEAYMRRQIYTYYKNASNNPWKINWNLPLTKEW